MNSHPPGWIMVDGPQRHPHKDAYWARFSKSGSEITVSVGVHDLKKLGGMPQDSAKKPAYLEDLFRFILDKYEGTYATLPAEIDAQDLGRQFGALLKAFPRGTQRRSDKTRICR